MLILINLFVEWIVLWVSKCGVNQKGRWLSESLASSSYFMLQFFLNITQKKLHESITRQYLGDERRYFWIQRSCLIISQSGYLRNRKNRASIFGIPPFAWKLSIRIHILSRSTISKLFTDQTDFNSTFEYLLYFNAKALWPMLILYNFSDFLYIFFHGVNRFGE